MLDDKRVYRALDEVGETLGDVVTPHRVTVDDYAIEDVVVPNGQWLRWWVA